MVLEARTIQGSETKPPQGSTRQRRFTLRARPATSQGERLPHLGWVAPAVALLTAAETVSIQTFPYWGPVFLKLFHMP